MATATATVDRIRPKKRGLRPSQREGIAGYLFLLPWILGFIGFTAGPILYSLYLSGTKYDILSAPRWIGLRNFTRIFDDRLFWQSLKVTSIFTFVSVPLGVVSGYSLALLLNQKIKGLSVWRMLFYVPAIVPALATAYLFTWIFNTETGLVNTALKNIGIQGPGWFSSRQWVLPAFWIMGLWGAGGGMILYLAALQGVPTELYEAAMLDGANSWRKFLNVTLPITSPVIFFTTLMGIIGTFQVFTGAFVITAGGPSDASLFYVLHLYNVAWIQARMGYAAALAWILFLIILVLTLVTMKVSGRLVFYGGDGGEE